MSKKKLLGGLDNLIASTSPQESSEKGKVAKRTFNLWVDVDLHQKVKIEAINKGMTMTDYIVSLIKKDLGL